MAEEPRPTGDAPSPFRRFPWAQLAFCVACLAMTAWTWMRYSYAWDVTPDDLAETYPRTADGSSSLPDSRWLDGPSRECLKWLPPEMPTPFGHRLLGRYVSLRADDTNAVSGRVVNKLRSTRPSATMPYLTVDSSRGRLTAESVGGLFVGAMGAFIFGLYLRRWLRERRAAA